MRFTRQRELQEKYLANERKLVQKFLWFPLTIDGETRWLEEVSYVCRVDWEQNIFTDRKYYYWKPWDWVNK
jgi:hypothetical protein